MNRCRRRLAKARRRERKLLALWDNAPYVCPGCHAVGEEPCAPGCIDDEMLREEEEYYDNLAVSWSRSVTPDENAWALLDEVQP